MPMPAVVNEVLQAILVMMFECDGVGVHRSRFQHAAQKPNWPKSVFFLPPSASCLNKDPSFFPTHIRPLSMPKLFSSV